MEMNVDEDDETGDRVAALSRASLKQAGTAWLNTTPNELDISWAIVPDSMLARKRKPLQEVRAWSLAPRHPSATSNATSQCNI